MHEITLIFDVFQRAYFLLLVLQLPFFITTRVLLGFFHFLYFSLYVNDSLTSMFTIIKHLKEKVLSFFLSKVLVYKTNSQTSVYLLPGFRV